MELQEVIQKNNQLMAEVLGELRAIRSQMVGQDVPTCTPKEALQILGLNNQRYLTYYYMTGLLNRRKGGRSFLYYKAECKALAEKFKNKELIVKPIKSIYES